MQRDVLEADNHVRWAEEAAHTHVISKDCESNFIPHVQEDVRKMGTVCGGRSRWRQ